MSHDIRRFLPAGFPAPELETIEKLRASVMQESKTSHRPEPAELAAAIAADEAGVDLSAIGAHDLWMLPPAEREPFFEAVSRLLAEQL